MPDVDPQPEVRRPILMVVVGCPRVGKTTVINTIIQKAREQGGELRIWNGDISSMSYNLGMLHDDVLAPESDGPEDVRTWLGRRIEDQISQRYDAILDVGAGNTPVAKLIQGLPLIRELEAAGILVVVVHVIGPEQADLAYLRTLTSEGTLQSKATLICLNAGLVMSERSVAFAFSAVSASPAIVASVEAGARLVVFPRLSCMSEVTSRRLTFRAAATGDVRPGVPPMMRFDRTRTQMWFDKAVPSTIACIPPLWRPGFSVGTVTGSGINKADPGHAAK